MEPKNQNYANNQLNEYYYCDTSQTVWQEFSHSSLLGSLLKHTERVRPWEGLPIDLSAREPGSASRSYAPPMLGVEMPEYLYVTLGQTSTSQGLYDPFIGYIADISCREELQLALLRWA